MLPSDFQSYIYKSRYARYDDTLGRREEWPETIDRYLNFFKDELKRKGVSKKGIESIPWDTLRDAISNLEVMPSMRCMMTAGEALERDNVSGYNCSYLPIDSVRAFDEVMYILMCGTGVGFSVERQYISKLPEVPDELSRSDSVIIFQDSKIGWAKGYRELLAMLFGGNVPRWDLSRIRPKGSRLRTFGGRASGPEPLEDLLLFTVALFERARGRKLTSVECHDLVCKVADIVVCGGVRRSALISLSNLTDERMRHAKSGEWYNDNPQRRLANNSVCYTEKPDVGVFMREWESLYESKSGERGIFSRTAAQAKARGSGGRRDPDHDFGTNPCSEIILRPNQFCNLSEVVVRSSDTPSDLRDKVELATILGTLQSILTTFRYLRSPWKHNTEDERLLGVSLTGIYDSGWASDYRDRTLCGSLDSLRRHAISTNNTFAGKLAISGSTATTCVKPSGTVSQLVNASSGIHPRYSRHYIRRVRADSTDPLGNFLRSKGIPCEQDFYSPGTDVFSFPVKAPSDCVTRNEVSALDQLRLWKVYQDFWCEHKPSITVYVRENEWMDVGAWVYGNFDDVSGVSFLPYDSGTYRQTPYEEITEDKYDELLAQMPTDIKWDEFKEETDTTTASFELACTAGACEIN